MDFPYRWSPAETNKMSQQIYWAVFFGRSWGKKKIWPRAFYKTAHEAKKECMQWKESYEEKLPYVKRLILKSKDSIHYDVYEHQTKLIRK